MKAVKHITDPEAFKILADDTRKRMIFLLRAKEMTVSQIADELNLTPQTVYHHIKRLVEAGMVEVTREVRVDHLIESYYMATAEVFHLTVGKTSGGSETLAEMMVSSLEALKKLGFNIAYTDKEVEQLVELTMERAECCSAKEYEEAVAKLEDLDLFTKEDVQEYASILSMSDKQLQEEDEIDLKFRGLLRSLIKKETKK
ncbi:MAG TPA: winged helix-turn-helix domain-containing protein [Candidatus Sulfotelmatobacter sp.]|nr:winged helix-turn-helix domain-containing protein [Candidatus Sulfotelmatobacter sp.]